MPAPDLLQPAYFLTPTWDYTLGLKVAEIAAAADLPPDPEQQLAIDAIFGERRGLPVVFEGLLVGGRQNYKSVNCEQLFLGWMFVTCEPAATWSAHQHKTARENFEDLAGRIEGTPVLSRHVLQVKDGEGSEDIILKGGPFGRGRHFPFVTRSTRAGRGRKAGKQIWDEYLYVTKTHEGTLMPAMSTFPDAQRVGATSAGLGMSARARSLRDRGRAMDPAAEPRLLYIEFCDDLGGQCAAGPECTHLYGQVVGCRYDDEDRYWRSNVGLHRGRITIQYVRDERRSLDPGEFGRERLGYWDEPTGDGDMVGIEDEEWAALADPSSNIVDEVVFGLDVNPARSWSSIVAAGMSAEGRKHAELTSRKVKGGDLTLDHRPGTTWLMPRFRKLAKGFPGARVRMLAKSQAETFGPRLESLGFRVEYIQPGDWPEAVSAVVDAIAMEELVHLGQTELDLAVGDAVLVDVGEERRRWGRRKSGGEIGPVMAMTAALSGVSESGPHIWG